MSAVAHSTDAASWRIGSALAARGTFPAAIPAAAVAGLGFAEGGYWPTTWGWAAAALGWAALLALLLRAKIGLGRLDLAYLGLITALLGWVAISAAWSPSTGNTVLEVERGLVYLTGVGAVLLVARRSDALRVLTGTWAGVTLVAVYALATKLRPGSLAGFDSVAGFRLAEPVGYWNGLGLLCGVGLLLGAGLAGRAPGSVTRLAAAASLPVLATTLSFTYSRGAWLATFLGLAALLASDRERLRAMMLIGALALPTGLAVVAAYRSEALNRIGTPLAEAAADGRRVAIVVALAACAAGLAAAGSARIAPRLPTGAGSRRLALVAIALCSAVLVAAAGGPRALAERAHHAFLAPPPRVAAGESATTRLVSLSGSDRETQWRVAADLFRDHPVAGAGAGAFQWRWLRDRPVADKVRDAHSLYIETLAELGVVGGALLAALLSVPLAAAARARRHAATPLALSAYVAFLAHAAIDWDWELPAVTLAGLLCGAALVVSARGLGQAVGGRARHALAAIAAGTATCAAIGLLGNAALAAGWDALESGKAEDARGHARAAAQWSPWSVEPLRLAAAAEAVRGRNEDALVNLREASRREPSNWNVWFDLAQLATGEEQRAALRRAGTLNPRSPEIGAYVGANALQRSG